MAKNINAVAILVNVSDVFWLPRKNYGRHSSLADNEQRRCEHAVMMHKRWDMNQTVEACEFTKEGLEEVELYITTEMAELEKVINDSEYKLPDDGMTKTIKLNAALRREAYRAIYFPGGKLKLPKYDATFAFQRGGSLPDAIALESFISGVKVTEVAKSYNIPVRVVEYASEAERVRACGLENTGKDTGRVSIMKHWPSLFQLAYDFFVAKAGAVSMAEINELLAGGVVKANNDGIKIHSLLTLDSRFPEAGIKDRILAGITKDAKGVETDEGQKFGESMDRTRVWKMVQYLDQKKVESDIANAKVDSTYSILTTLDVVKAYIANPYADKETTVKPVTAKQIDSHRKMTQSPFVRYILYALTFDRMDLLAHLYTPVISLEVKAEFEALAEKIGIAKDGKIGTTDKNGKFTELV